MHRHAFRFEAAHGTWTLSAYERFLDAWLDGIDRQRRLQTEAVREFCTAQLNNLRTLSETTDATQFATRFVALAAPAPLQAIELSARLGEIAAETQRQLVELMESHVQRRNDRSSLADTKTHVDGVSRKITKRSRNGRSRQMTA